MFGFGRLIEREWLQPLQGRLFFLVTYACVCAAGTAYEDTKTIGASSGGSSVRF